MRCRGTRTIKLAPTCVDIVPGIALSPAPGAVGTVGGRQPRLQSHLWRRIKVLISIEEDQRRSTGGEVLRNVRLEDIVGGHAIAARGDRMAPGNRGVVIEVFRGRIDRTAV